VQGSRLSRPRVEVYASRSSSSGTSNWLRRFFTQLILSVDSPSSSSRSAASGEHSRMNGDFISVGEALKLVPGEALKLVPPFKGDKREVLAFIGNVDTAFAVLNPSQEAVLYKFVLTRISG